jgi:Ca2+-binding EF-hand superfamily protein
MNLKSLIATLIATALAGSLAYAGGDTKSNAEAMFKTMDKNKDGFVSQDEAKGTPHEKDFPSLDKDADGKLSRQEHAVAHEQAG